MRTGDFGTPRSLPQGFVNVVAAFGGPIATAARSALGIDGGVDSCSIAFQVGQAAGAVITAAGGPVALLRGTVTGAAVFTGLGVSQSGAHAFNNPGLQAAGEVATSVLKAKMLGKVAKYSAETAAALDLSMSAAKGSD